MDVTVQSALFALLSAVAVALISVLPNIVAGRRQERTERATEKKLAAERSSIIEQSAIDLLAPYRDLLKDIAERYQVERERRQGIEANLDYEHRKRQELEKKVEGMSQEIEQMLVREKELTRSNRLLKFKVDDLAGGVLILSQQLQEAEIPPKYQVPDTGELTRRLEESDDSKT